eukprot:1141215-Pelagomonas_calceolata.AAC.1
MYTVRLDQDQISQDERQIGGEDELANCSFLRVQFKDYEALENGRIHTHTHTERTTSAAHAPSRAMPTGI